MENKILDQATTIIISPHPDDEAIGCFKQLQDPTNQIVIIYSGDTKSDRRETVLKIKEKLDNIKAQLFQTSIPTPFINRNNKFFFPDPVYEIHPQHRQWGFVGEQLARNGFDVTFYNTIMNAPYIHEVPDPMIKQSFLNEVYPDQKSLWEYDHKYFLFEGYCKWLF